MRAHGLALLLFAVAGCAPRLGNGVFGCPDGICPSGYVCDADRRCRVVVERPDGGPMPDGGMPMPDAPPGVDGGLPPPIDGGGTGLPPYAACAADSECASGDCYLGHSGYTWDHGYCVPPCSGGCPDAGQGEVSCEHPTEICRIFCSPDRPCAGGWLCSLFSRTGTPGNWDDSGECLPPGVPVQAVPFDPCATETECWPGICANLPAGTRCVRPCGPGSACAPGFMCRMSPSRGDVCLPSMPP